MVGKIRRTSLFLVVFFFIPSAICGQERAVRVGMSLGLSGRYEVIAKMQERAFRMWESQVNARGGILGSRVELIIHDDKSSVEEAKRIYQRMIDEEVDLLLPPYSSGLTNGILPITEAHGYPLLIHGAAADEIWQQGYNYAFGILPPASRYTLGFLEMLLMNNMSKVAVIHAEDSFSITIAQGAERWAKRLGMEIVYRKSIKKGTKDLDGIAREVKNASAQALIMCGHFNESINMRQGLINIGWYPKAYWASVGPVFQSYREHFQDKADNSFSSTLWTYYDKLPFPGSKPFYDDFLAAYGVEPSYHAASAYTAGVLLRAAIEKAGGVKRERIREILASMDMMTMLGRYGVDRTGMQIRYFHLTIQWLDGQKEIVWPLELSTASPNFP